MIPLCQCTNTYEEAVNTRSLLSTMSFYVSSPLSDVNKPYCPCHYKHDYGISTPNHYNNTRNNTNTGYTSLPTEIDVLVIGTGPSALFTSYLLHGYRPILESHDLPRLHQLLPTWLSTPLTTFVGVPLTNSQLLKQIAVPLLDSPLGARSRNPLALLLDVLERPGADQGEQHASLLTWKRVAHPIRHCVVGRTDPGGLWSHMAQDEQLALSVANQLALPGYTFTEWWQQYCDTSKYVIHDDDIEMTRPTRSAIAHYYKKYVEHTGISDAIFTTTTSNIYHDVSALPYHRYQIKGWRTLTTTTSTSTSSNSNNISLLACGMFDEPKRLGVPGESAHWIQHHSLVSHVQPSLPRSRELPDIVTLPLKATSTYATSMPSSFYYPDTSNDKHQQQQLQQQLPYLVVGSGLSAADALHRLRHRGQRVLHVFLSDRTYRSRKRSHASPPLARGFTADTYPEYHATRRRMVRAQRTPTPSSSSSSVQDDMTWYEGLPQFLRGRLAISSHSRNIHNPQQHSTSNSSSNVPMIVEYGRPLRIDPWTSRVIDEQGNDTHTGLYAIGAITGDTTVRFSLGASLGALIDLTHT
ncbi:hypothetical protein BDF22DRAFT_686585 [Syncephalis plumigaleata]|nr:hypothetical protein BDF22DRAFT_686585 [Syncephalis plumigaleata]